MNHWGHCWSYLSGTGVTLQSTYRREKSVELHSSLFLAQCEWSLGPSLWWKWNESINQVMLV